jgi:hypothetical protein
MDPFTRRAIETRLAEIELQLEKSQRGLAALARIQNQESVTEQEHQIRTRMKALQNEVELLNFVMRRTEL